MGKLGVILTMANPTRQLNSAPQAAEQLPIIIVKPVTKTRNQYCEY
jgi:hypothetical protein